MFIETLHIKYSEELDILVNEFITDKIIYVIKYQPLILGWDVHIFYDDIPEGGEQSE